MTVTRWMTTVFRTSDVDQTTRSCLDYRSKLLRERIKTPPTPGGTFPEPLEGRRSRVVELFGLEDGWNGPVAYAKIARRSLETGCMALVRRCHPRTTASASCVSYFYS